MHVCSLSSQQLDLVSSKGRWIFHKSVVGVRLIEFGKRPRTIPRNGRKYLSCCHMSENVHEISEIKVGYECRVWKPTIRVVEQFYIFDVHGRLLTLCYFVLFFRFPLPTRFVFCIILTGYSLCFVGPSWLTVFLARSRPTLL